MGLIEDARLTDEERTACMWDPDGYGRLGEQVEIAIAEAQLAKAMDKILKWLDELPNYAYNYEAKTMLALEIEAAGMKVSDAITEVSDRVADPGIPCPGVRV